MSRITVIPVTDPSQITEARRSAEMLARSASFDETKTGQLAIIVTEAATNLIKHGGGGDIMLRIINGAGIEMLALDKGAGMANAHACMTDGYSTAGSPGNGLGAIRRLADEFDIYSAQGQGTALCARIWAGNAPKQTKPIEISGIAIPIQGEEVCGDSWAARFERETVYVSVADGLGHGVLAAEASKEAIRIFSQPRMSTPAGLLKDIHFALRATRGAAVAVASINLSSHVVTYTGVGNIAGVIAGDIPRHMVSLNGTAGQGNPKFQEFTYDWPSDSVLVMASDGIQTRWNLVAYPGLTRKSASVIAGVLYRDYTRGRDDATVVVAKWRPQ